MNRHLSLLLPALLLVTLPAFAQSGDGVLKLAAPGLSGVNVSAEEADFFNEYFAEKLSARGGIKITTASEVRAVLGLERQKQLLGCDEDSACLTEIANALGVDGIVMGSVARFGDRYGINLKVIDATTSEKLGAESAQVDSAGGVLPYLEAAAVRIARDLKRSAVVTETALEPADREAARAEREAVRKRVAQESAVESENKALRQAAARNMIRVDIPLISVGYEYRVLDYLRVGGRLRFNGGFHGGPYGESAFAVGGDFSALVRYEPFMARPVGFSLHGGLAVGSYVWVGDDNNYQDNVGPVLGAELILGRVWRVGAELLLLTPNSRAGTGGFITTLTLGRAFLF